MERLPRRGSSYIWTYSFFSLTPEEPLSGGRFPPGPLLPSASSLGRFRFPMRDDMPSPVGGDGDELRKPRLFSRLSSCCLTPQKLALFLTLMPGKDFSLAPHLKLRRNFLCLQRKVAWISFALTTLLKLRICFFRLLESRIWTTNSKKRGQIIFRQKFLKIHMTPHFLSFDMWIRLTCEFMVVGLRSSFCSFKSCCKSSFCFFSPTRDSKSSSSLFSFNN